MKKAGWVGMLCSVAAGGMAALAIWSWGAGVGNLFTTAVHKPTAPGAALLLGAASLALFLFHIWPHRRGIIRLARGTAVFVAIAGLYVGVRRGFGWTSLPEEWLAQVLGLVTEPKVFLMSPLSGGTLGVVAVAFLLRLPPLGRKAVARWVSCGLGAVVTLVSAAMAANCALEKPWLVGGADFPMAPWTALNLLFLGGALLAPLPAADEPPDGTHSDGLTPGTDTIPLAICGVLALVIAVLGAWYLRQEQAEIRGEARETLQSIARLKALDIAHWRQERLGDARFFSKAAFVARDTQAFLERPASEPARADVRNWLTLLKAGDRYAMVGLYDTNLVLRSAVPEPTNALSAGAQELLAAALRTNGVIMTDLHRDEGSNDIHLSMVFTVFAPASPAATLSLSRPLGVVLIHLDARQFLYPLVRSWPTHSPSAEIELVRREGNEAVFLNPLRHRANTALNVRFPADPRSRLPAAMAALGQTGPVEGLDYRRVPVLASIQPVPDSPWFVIAKVDQDEVYAPLRAQAWLILALTAILAVTAGLVVWLLSKRRDAIRALRELAAERQRRVLAERVEHLMKSANDIILLADDQWRILEANDRALTAYGYSLLELQRMKLVDLRPPEERAKFASQTAHLVADGQILIETVHQRKDGSTFPVENSARIIEIGGARYNLAILRDTTQRQAHEREIERLNRLYRTLSELNQILVRVKTRDALFQEACRIAVEHAGFKLVWIGSIDHKTHEVRVTARAGNDAGYLDQIEVYADRRPEGSGPVGTCIRAGKPCVVNDFLDDPSTAPWHNAAAAHGLRAVAALPIRTQGAIWGTFTVYAGETGCFQDREVALLEEAAAAISYALDNLDREEQRQRAETALRESEERYRLLADNVEDFVTVLDTQENRLYISPSFYRITGWTAEEVLRTAWDARLHPDELPLIRQSRAANLAGEATLTEHRIRCRDDSWIWVESRCKPLLDAEGRVRQLLIWQHDITERKQAEEALRASEEAARILNRRLQTLQQAIAQLATARTLDDIMVVARTAARQLTGADGATFVLRDGDRCHYADEDAIAPLWKGQRFPMSACISGWVMLNQQSVLIEDIYADPRIPAEAYRPTFVKSLAMVPIRATAPLGAIGNYWASRHRPSAEEMDLLRSLADGAAVAMENVQSYQLLEHRVRQRTVELEAANQELEAFSYSVSHDLRAPLRTVDGFSQALIEDFGPQLPETARRYLHLVSQGARQMGHLIDDLLAFSRLSRQALRKRELDTAQLVREVIESLRTEWEGRKVELNIGPLPPCHGDPALLKQVWVNLLANALKYTRRRDCARLEVGCCTQEGETVFYVRDNGTGFDMKYAHKLFGVFQRLHRAEDFEGTGVGLAIVQRVIHRHGGRVWAEAEEDRGATFSFTLENERETKS